MDSDRHRSRATSFPGKWLLPALAAIALSLGLTAAGPDAMPGAAGAILSTTLAAGSVLLCLATLWIALWRQRLFDIDLILNRALVYGSLTAAVAGV